LTKRNVHVLGNIYQSSAWYGVRAGRVTASAMHAVVVYNIEKLCPWCERCATQQHCWLHKTQDGELNMRQLQGGQTSTTTHW